MDRKLGYSGIARIPCDSTAFLLGVGLMLQHQ